jgi:hypothetical protein
VPTYRLISGNGVPLESFEADDDVVARVRGRELAGTYVPWAPDLSGRRGDLAVERDMGGRWAPIAAWVPRPRGQMSRAPWRATADPTP